MNETNTLALKPCYSKAWKSFAKWWIPICLLAGGLMVFNWIPKQFAKAESSALSQTIDKIVAAAGQDDLSQLEALTTELIETMQAYAAKLLTFSFYAPLEEGGRAMVQVTGRSTVMGVGVEDAEALLADLDDLRPELPQEPNTDFE